MMPNMMKHFDKVDSFTNMKSHAEKHTPDMNPSVDVNQFHEVDVNPNSPDAVMKTNADDEYENGIIKQDTGDFSSDAIIKSINDSKDEKHSSIMWSVNNGNETEKQKPQSPDNARDDKSVVDMHT